MQQHANALFRFGRTAKLLLSLILLNASFVALVADAALISSSQLEMCQNDGSEKIPCSRKFVVAVSINGDQADTEYITFLRTATDTTTGKTQNLNDPIRISVRKSSPMIRYPLTYVQNFNNLPYENSLTTSALRCKADASDSDPTCGRAYNSAGAPITNSEGYCCDCSFCELFGVCSSTSRANVNCALFGDGAAATCLKFDSLWYSAYRVGAAQTWYTITVTVSNSKVSQTMELGPDKLGAVNTNFGVTAQLIGDFAAFKTAPSYNNKYLMVPSYPPTNPRVLDSTPGKEWMLVDTDRVTLDGSECNKIGVSYLAMVTQGSRCQAVAGSCTKSQLDNFRSADLVKDAAGLAGSYLMKNFGSFVYIAKDGTVTSSKSNAMMNHGASTSGKQSVFTRRHFAPKQFQDESRGEDELTIPLDMDIGQYFDVLNGELTLHHNPPTSPLTTTSRNRSISSSSMKRFDPQADTPSESPYVAYFQDSVQASLVTLTFAADNISYTINVADGIIIAFNISTFAANSQNGKLSVIIMNNGSIAADFSLTVTGCSPGTFPLTAQVSTLGALSIKEFIFDVYSSNTAGSTSNACNLTLYNSLFIPIQTAVVKWTTDAQEQDNGAQGGNNSAGGGGSHSGDSTSSGGDGDSCTSCPFYNPICFITKSCFWQVVIQVATCLGIILGICILIKFRKPIMTCVSCLIKDDEDKTDEEPKSGNPQRRRPSQSKNSNPRPPSENPSDVEEAEEEAPPVVVVPTPTSPTLHKRSQILIQQHYQTIKGREHHGIPASTGNPKLLRDKKISIHADPDLELEDSNIYRRREEEEVEDRFSRRGSTHALLGGRRPASRISENQPPLMIDYHQGDDRVGGGEPSSLSSDSMQSIHDHQNHLKQSSTPHRGPTASLRSPSLIQYSPQHNQASAYNNHQRSPSVNNRSSRSPSVNNQHSHPYHVSPHHHHHHHHQQPQYLPRQRENYIPSVNDFNASDDYDYQGEDEDVRVPPPQPSVRGRSSSAMRGSNVRSFNGYAHTSGVPCNQQGERYEQPDTNHQDSYNSCSSSLHSRHNQQQREDAYNQPHPPTIHQSQHNHQQYSSIHRRSPFANKINNNLYPDSIPMSPMAESIDRMSLSMQDSMRSAYSASPSRSYRHNQSVCNQISSPPHSRHNRVPHDPFASVQSLDNGAFGGSVVGRGGGGGRYADPSQMSSVHHPPHNPHPNHRLNNNSPPLRLPIPNSDNADCRSSSVRSQYVDSNEDHTSYQQHALLRRYRSSPPRNGAFENSIFGLQSGGSHRSGGGASPPEQYKFPPNEPTAVYYDEDCG